MKKCLISFVCITFALFLSLPHTSLAAVHIAHLAPEEISSHKQLTALLLKKFPPQEHHYIILGRSPALIATQLEFLGVSFSHLPLSFRFFSQHSKQAEADYDRVLDEDLRIHFANYLPPKSMVKNKTLVVIDYVLSGRSLLSGVRLVNQYYQNKNVYFFGFGDYEKQFQHDQGVYIDLTKIDRTLITSKGFYTGKYKNFSCFPSFRFINMHSEYYEHHEQEEAGAILSNLRYQQAVLHWSRIIKSAL